MSSIKDEQIKAEDERLIHEAERILDSDSPALSAYRELILEVLRILLDQKPIKKRIKLVLTPEQTTAFEGKLYDHIAIVVSKTYSELGDVAELADDVAVQLIRDLLLDYDPKLIDRNRFRKIKRIKLRRRW
jgi:hypothetical protein